MFIRYLLASFIIFCFTSCDHQSMISDLEEQIAEKNDTTAIIKHEPENNDTTKTALPNKTPEDSLRIQ